MPDTPGEVGADRNPPNPTEIRVFSVGKSLKIEPFKIFRRIPWKFDEHGKNVLKISKKKHRISRLQK